MLNPATWSLPGRLRHIKLIPGLGEVEMLGMSLYGAQGIQDVLKDVLQDPKNPRYTV